MPKSCSVEGCEQPLVAKGLCTKHYQRKQRHGLIEGKYRRPPADRFWESVERAGDDECWLWRGNAGGEYGIFHRHARDGGRLGAHRFSYELANGPIPSGHIVMHTCDVPLCVNPAHLRVGTPKDNMADMDAKGRRVAAARRGQTHGNAALTEFQVRFIKQSEQSNRFLGRLFNVTTNTIRAIRIGRTWAHLT